MAGKSSKGSISRVGIGIGLIVQTACVIFLIAAANYIGFNYYERWDFSRSQKFVLADQTKRVLREVRELKKKVKFIVYFSPSNMGLETALYPDVNNLLREIEFAQRKNVKIEIVDPVRQLGRARELQSDYKFGGNENVLIIDYDGRTKFIPIGEMGDFDLSGLAYGEPAKLVAFRGEQVITTALIALLNPEPRKAAFLEGHGELSLADGGPLSMVRDAIARQNVEIEPLNLGSADRVPGDIGVLCIFGPRYDFSDREIEVLRKYWRAEGRLIILLNPDASTPNLNAFIAEAGIVPQDNRVLKTVDVRAQAGFIAIIREVVGSYLDDSVITKRLRLQTVNSLFPGATQSFTLDGRKAMDEGVVLRRLVEAAEEFWGETQYENTEQTGVQYDDGVDDGYPVTLAAVAEKGAATDDRVEVASSKMAVVGNADFVTDEVIRQFPANLDFIVSAVNWMLERSKLTGVAPKANRTFSLNLTDVQMQGITLYALIVMPGLAALLGFIVWLRRRA